MTHQSVLAPAGILKDPRGYCLLLVTHDVFYLHLLLQTLYCQTIKIPISQNASVTHSKGNCPKMNYCMTKEVAYSDKLAKHCKKLHH